MMKRKILVVDDEKMLARALAAKLSRDGYHTATAHTGEEALRLTQSGGFDLVVTDLKMPGVGGIELIRRLARTSPHTKAVVMTAYGTMESVLEALRLGVCDFVMKPFRTADLLAAIARAFPEPVTASAASPAVAGEPATTPMTERLARPNVSFTIEGEAKQLAPGTFYDFIGMEGGRLAILFGSVDPPAAPGEGLLAAVPAVARAGLQRGCAPAAVLAEINDWLCYQWSSLGLVSIFCGVVDAEKTSLEYAVLGEVRTRVDDRAWHGGAGPAAGLFPGLEVSGDTLSVSPGSRLVLTFAEPGPALSVDLGTKPEPRSVLRGRVPVPAVSRGLADVMRHIETIASEQGLSDRDTHQIITALNEALINALTWGRGGEVSLEYCVRAGEFCLRVSDHGEGFELGNRTPSVDADVPPLQEHGRGFFLMRRLTDRLFVESRPGQGTTVYLVKRTNATEGAS